MKEKEFVNGDAYIVSRNWKPVVCNWCNCTTTTSIRVPSLMLYLAWCENCQKVPQNSWKLPHSSLFSNLTVSTFETLLAEYYLTGCNYKYALRLAINETSKTKKEISLEHLEYLESLDSSNPFQDYHSDNNEISIISRDESYYNTTDIPTLLSNILDLNKILKRVLAIITDQEREILILILYKCQLDDFLSVDTKKLLYQDFNINTIDNTKLKQKERAKFLGFPLYKFKKNTDTLLKKTKKILLTSGFKEEIRYLEKQVNLNNV